MSERGRLFVAVIPPANVLVVLAAIPREPRPDVRYTTREQWHVTLRFLGDADIGEATAALQRVDAPSVEAVLGPSVERLGRSVAMVPCAGLDEVAAAVRRATTGIEHPMDAARDFVGHLTIARMKNSRRCPATGFAVAASFAVTEVHLVRSHLSRDGSRYEVVSSRALESLSTREGQQPPRAPRPPGPGARPFP
ncbi:MAG TPA: 2'-5' RNA ligase family protein [Acidimicrobiales bacterium]|nr:2'-5' RNA ligase family protein [Acidimicrobiales bacterium]